MRVGISGWRYAGWRGRFYPPGLPQRLELHHASRAVGTIELNGSFYSLQRPESYRRWREEVPADYLLSVKGSRYVTHMLRLRDVERALANLFASGVLALGPVLGPVLWQLPPTTAYDPDRLDAFLALLPRTFGEAAALAEGHDERVEGRSWTDPGPDPSRRIRHVLEVRHDSFSDPGFPELLRRRDVGLVVADTAGRWPLLTDVTSDVVYVRLHGAEELYVSGYDDDALDRWAERVRGWSRAGADVLVYFDNDAKVHAPFDAQRLAERLECSVR